MANLLHEDELAVDANLVRKLVDHNFPQWADLPLTRLGASGSTNVQFRLGDTLLVRLPRQAGGSSGIDKEFRWTPAIGPHLPVAVPEFLGVGEPGFGYSERWSVVRWLEGELPSSCCPPDPPESEGLQLAADLADVILSLRSTDIPAHAANERALRNYRGRSLTRYDKYLRATIDDCKQLNHLDLDLDAALAVWEDALKLPGAAIMGPDTWYHSDLVAENLLLTGGRLTAVLDFGGLGIGDPTVDLHGAWELFDGPARDVFRARLGVDEYEWLRGRAWALAIALGTFAYYWKTMPGRIEDRLAMARSVLADAADNRP